MQNGKDRFWISMGIVLFVNLIIPLVVPLFLTTGSASGDVLLLCGAPFIGGLGCLSRAESRREKVLAAIALAIGAAWLSLLLVFWKNGDLS